MSFNQLPMERIVCSNILSKDTAAVPSKASDTRFLKDNIFCSDAAKEGGEVLQSLRDPVEKVIGDDR